MRTGSPAFALSTGKAPEQGKLGPVAEERCQVHAVVRSGDDQRIDQR